MDSQPSKKKYRVVYDRKNCIGVLTCAAFYPERWKINEGDNKADLHESQEDQQNPGTFILEFTEEELERLKSSAEVCPVNVIHIEDVETGRRVV